MRMRQDPGESPAGGSGAYFPAHAHAGANGEASSLRDEQLGQIFRNMRLTMKVSRETIARRLATSTASIDTFEAGAIGALPHGKETERIVRGYCELLRLDPEPILWRIRGHMQTLASPPATPMPTTRAALGRCAGHCRPSRDALADGCPQRATQGAAQQGRADAD